MNDFPQIKDWLRVVVKDKYGNIKSVHEDEDLITNAGKALVAGLLLSDVGGTAFDYIAIGSGSTSPAAGDTALDAELTRAPATGTRITTTVTNDTAQLVYTFSSGNPAGLHGTSTGSRSIKESGIFNAGAGGTMLCRQTFTERNIDWDAGDSLEVTWKVQVS